MNQGENIGSKGILALFCSLFLAFSATVFAEECTYQAEILNTYPHDSNAFTQGLTISNGELFEGTGLHGRSSLRRVDLESGELLQRRNLDERYFGEGIAVWGDRIYQLTWRSNIGFVYDRESFALQRSFYLPGEGWGLTHDGIHLIVSDGTPYLRFLDPESLTETHRVQVNDSNGPIPRLNELEYINGEVWANVWYEDYLVRIDPLTGRVSSRVDLSSLYPQRQSREEVLNGIAWDEEAQRLFVTGKLWPYLYEIRVLE